MLHVIEKNIASYYDYYTTGDGEVVAGHVSKDPNKKNTWIIEEFVCDIICTGRYIEHRISRLSKEDMMEIFADGEENYMEIKKKDFDKVKKNYEKFLFGLGLTLNDITDDYSAPDEEQSERLYEASHPSEFR